MRQFNCINTIVIHEILLILRSKEDFLFTALEVNAYAEAMQVIYVLREKGYRTAYTGEKAEIVVQTVVVLNAQREAVLIRGEVLRIIGLQL